MSLPILPESLRHTRLKARKVGAASGHGGEGSHFVIGLQVVHVGHGNAHAVRVAAGPAEPRNIPQDDQPTLIGKMVTSFVSLTFFMILSSVSLLKRVDSGGDEDDVLLAFDPVEAIERVV